MKTPLPSALKTPYTTGFLLTGIACIAWATYCLSIEWYWQSCIPLGMLLGATALINERIVFYLLCLTLPFSLDIKMPGSGFSVSAPAEPLIGFLAAIVLFRFTLIPNAFHRIKHPITLCLVAWWLVQWINVAFSTMPMVSMKWMIVQTAFILVFYMMPLWIEEQKKGTIPMAWILFTIGYVILECYATYRHSYRGFARFAAMESVFPYFNDHTLYGTCGAFILALMMVFYPQLQNSPTLRKYSLIMVGIILILPVAIFLSYSRASWISLLCIPGVLFLLKWKITPIKILVSICAIATLLLVTFSIWYPILKKNDNDSKKRKTNLNEQLKSVTNINSDLSNMERLNRWSCAIRMTQDKPLTGFGPGTYQFQYIPYQKLSEMTWISMTSYSVNQAAGKGGTAHSEYLLQASESGVIVLGLYITLIFLIFHYGFQVVLYSSDQYSRYTVMAALCGLATFVFHTSFNNFLDQSKAAFLFWSCAAVIVLAHHKLKEQGKQEYSLKK